MSQACSLADMPEFHRHLEPAACGPQRDVIGADKILFKSDCPHADTRGSQAKPRKELFRDVDQEIIDQITHNNAEKLVKFR